MSTAHLTIGHPYEVPVAAPRRRIITEIDAHNQRQREHGMRALLQVLNDVPSSSVPNKRDEELIEKEARNDYLLSLPFRPDDHYVSAAFAKGTAPAHETADSATADEDARGRPRKHSSVRDAAFDALRLQNTVVMGHLGVAHEHSGQRGRQRSRVHISLQKERKRREKASRATEVRSPRETKRDAAARHRQKKRKPTEWLLGTERPDAWAARDAADVLDD